MSNEKYFHNTTLQHIKDFVGIYGWSLAYNPQLTEITLFNRRGKEVASIVKKNGWYRICNTFGNLLLAGNDDVLLGLKKVLVGYFHCTSKG